MFGIGFSEMIVIGVILIIAVGPSRMPGMLKAVVRAYREFRRATRELRASTGIDDILQDEDLRSLRKPLNVPAAKKPVAQKRRSLSYVERAQENPSDGVDIAEIRAAEARPSAEEAERIRLAKEAEVERDEHIIAAKLAAEDDPMRAAKIASAEREDDPVRAAKLASASAETDDLDPDAERIRAAKIAAAEREDPADAERIRAAKMAAAEREDPADAERIRAAKMAAAEREDPADAERIRAAKMAAAEREDPADAERIRAAKMAVAERQEPAGAESIRARKIAAAESEGRGATIGANAEELSAVKRTGPDDDAPRAVPPRQRAGGGE